MSNRPGTRIERARATREALVRAARELFAERGFAATSTNEVVERAGVTRGALYHHFGAKEDLFEAVYEDVETGVVEQVVAALASATGPVEQLAAGMEAFLDACLDEAVQRIVLLEGPSVLGWARWREIDLRYGLGLVRSGLEGAMAAGAIKEQPVDPLAHVVLGALIEAGLVVAHAPDPRRARAEMSGALRTLLDGLTA